MPVILYANGGCANNNVEMRNLLNEVASFGYVAAAIMAMKSGCSLTVGCPMEEASVDSSSLSLKII